MKSKMPTRKKKSKPAPARSVAAALGKIRGLETEMSQVIREMQEKVRQLEFLNEFSRLMNSSLDTRVVQQKALEATCQLIGCEMASLLLIDKAKGELFWQSSLGEYPIDPEQGEKIQSIRIPIDDQSISGYVAMSAESVIVNDVPNDPRFKKRKNYADGATIQTMICVPLRTKDKIIGVLQALNKLSSVSARPSRHTWPDFYENDKNLLETLSNSIAIAIENAQLYSDIKKNFFETVEALAEAIEKKDHYTGGHTKRVVHYAECIAKYLNLNNEDFEKVRLASILHDVGKIGIEDRILKKQSALSPEEWKVMQMHPDMGYEILARVEGLKDVIGATRYHHERWDGKGYPSGLKGEEIPLMARIVAVADTYDAMVSTRPYRKGMDPKLAYEEIVKYSGTQFDPVIVAAFIEAFRYEKMGKGSGGSQFEGESGLLSNCD